MKNLTNNQIFKKPLAMLLALVMLMSILPVTMGISEEETIDKLTGIVSQIIAQEERLRESIYNQKHDELTDKVRRSYGLMKHAYKMTYDELIEHISNCRLGISLRILTDVDITTLNRLLITMANATISEQVIDESAEVTRAKLLQNSL